ncbi:calcium-binding protein [Microcystis sp. M061S2]|uniref:calcium-binding protein n=1 Tax=Microcystis sp. M061S2 TaxID=2771171 RepID=UPI00258D7248|nr:calcium-binding protein [Microcystis sp. M061S2]MCA2652869.1 calcium-binding protein [Microcystis sp. M061S2]
MNEQLKQCAKAAFMLASAPFAFIESVAFADIQFKDIRLEINARSSGDVLFPPPVFDSMGFTMYGNEGQDSFLIKNEAKDFLIGNEGQDTFLIENEAKDFLIGNEGQDTFLIENEAKDFLMMREDSTYSFLIENEAFVSFLIENEAKFVNPFQFKRLLDHIISHRKQDMIEEAREFLIRNKQLTLLALQNAWTTLMAFQNTLTLVFSVAEINPISISGQIWTDKVEGKVEERQLLLTTYTIACTCIRQSLKFIRGLRSTTKSNLSSTCSNTILGFFLTGSCCVQF